MTEALDNLCSKEVRDPLPEQRFCLGRDGIRCINLHGEQLISLLLRNKF